MNDNRLAAALIAGVIGGALVLTSCANDDGDQGQTATSTAGHHQSNDGHDNAESSDDEMDHSTMEHPVDGGPPPEGITAAVDPKYPVGTRVMLTTDHMDGMNGAKAKIVGAYTTYTYSVTYTPTTGGARVTDHKWVVQEEIEDAGEQRLPNGTEVTLLAEHMTGMEGATATIASSTAETVYMVDYEADGMTMTNHKWVVESEVEPAS